MRAPRRSPSCQPADSGCRRRQPGHFLESASLHPPQAALRCFPRRPLQKEHPIRQDGVFFLEMCRSTGELAASTCAERVKSRGEAGFLRMATAIRGMPGSEFEPRRGRVTSPTRSAEPRSKSGVGGQRKRGNIFLKVFSAIAKCKSICYDCVNKRRDFCEFARI